MFLYICIYTCIYIPKGYVWNGTEPPSAGSRRAAGGDSTVSGSGRRSTALVYIYEYRIYIGNIHI
jgi:hypothetical protein